LAFSFQLSATMLQHFEQQSLLFSGSVPLSRHCSSQGAIDASPRVGRQTRLYMDLLATRGTHGATDWEASILLGLQRSTINARRVPLTKGDEPWVTSTETRPGPTGRVPNAVWVLTVSGRKALDEAGRAAHTAA
jgi:hypothetical protein